MHRRVEYHTAVQSSQRFAWCPALVQRQFCVDHWTSDHVLFCVFPSFSHPIPRMVSEVDLAVTVHYKTSSSKAKLSSVEEATPIIRRDLSVLKHVHPKQANISIVWPGAVRFYWSCLPGSVIYQTVKTLDSDTNNNPSFRRTLDSLFIERIIVRETESRQPVFQSPATTLEPAVSIKAEPVYDIPIPPYSRGSDVIDVDKPSTPRILRRDRYKSSSESTSENRVSYEDSHTLQLELSEVRRRINIEIVRERAILSKLEALGETNSDADDDISSVKARFRLLEAELRQERLRRHQAEAFVDDIRREQQTPFVVPALLDAFADISRLTNESH
ncbi:hypothetical protein MIND_00618100 [Mycena indigotica]|uniref:Uncharacterized protein n=1 Tax=Mycena indigotica TaxID=2126181 RepID=A0A8H6STZ1_9AGAR|nr:uncharacterized protein MIND_00618100 [Mycena indigotica]KAF7303880.1 hypothetical protein MIND_00618100 [Mycena indigotica]